MTGLWVPHARHCPLCGEVETHDHAVSACSYLGLSASLTAMLLPQPEVGGIARSAPNLVLNHIPTSLSSAAGLVFWSVVSVNWSFRCATSLSGSSRLPDTVFLRKWLQALRSWSGASLQHLPEAELVLFEKAFPSAGSEERRAKRRRRELRQLRQYTFAEVE